MLNEAARQQLMKDLDVLIKQYQIGFDDFLQELSNEFKDQAARTKMLKEFGCETTASVLESLADNLSDASMNFYVSTK